MTAACATDDGKLFADRHFGDALRTAAEAFSRVHALWVEGEERSHLTLKTAPLEKEK